MDCQMSLVLIPEGATPQTPWKLTRQSRRRYYSARPAQRKSLSDRGPMGYEIDYSPDDLEKDSDLYALLVEKKVSITPISIDLTSRTDFPALKAALSD